MSLLPEQSSYLEQVQAYFLAFRGDGVCLSPNDAKLLKEWQDAGVPYAVVCRGIRKAAESILHHDGPDQRLRTLQKCKSFVRAEFDRYRGLSAGKTRAAADASKAAAEPPESFAHKRMKKARKLLEKALREAPSGAHQRALQRALKVLERVANDPQEASRLVARAEDALAVGYVRDLPFESRRGLVHDARQQAGPKPAGATARARKDALRAHLVALARARGNLVALA